MHLPYPSSLPRPVHGHRVGQSRHLYSLEDRRIQNVIGRENPVRHAEYDAEVELPHSAVFSELPGSFVAEGGSL